MPDINIDRMSVTLEGVSTDDGKRLAHLISEKLAAASHRLQGSTQAAAISVSASAGQGIDRIAEKIVEDIVRQLNRSI
jgi:hypothetical protein